MIPADCWFKASDTSAKADLRWVVMGVGDGRFSRIDRYSCVVPFSGVTLSNWSTLLAQGCRPVASPVVQPHELAMRRFVQGVRSELASGVQQGPLVPARGAVMVYQTLEHVGQVATQTLGLPELSLLETGAVAQAETCQEVARIELCRLGQCYYADRADVVWGVRVCLALRTQRAKLERINPGFGVRSSPTASRPILNPPRAMALLSVESVRLKGSAGAGLVGVRPQ